MNFWNGFLKRAAKQEQAPPSGQNMLKWNAQGGVAPRTPEAMAAAEQADLVTLPANVPGTNCGNCMHARVIDTKEGTGYCTKLNTDVTDRMCCNFWDAPGTLRDFATPDAAEVPPSAADEIAQDFQGSVDPQTGQPMQATGQEQEQAPAGDAKPKKEKKDKPKKDEKSTHTINVNVGKGK